MATTKIWYCPRGCQTLEADVWPEHCGACCAPFSSDPSAYDASLQELEERDIQRTEQRKANQ